MPNYEYICEDCGWKFDKRQPIKSRPLRKCSKCGGKLVRLVGKNTTIVFRGEWPGKGIR